MCRESVQNRPATLQGDVRFPPMTNSLSSITNSCTSDARMVLVVQDSYYKEVRVDLASLLPELADQYGWRLRSKTPFAVISSKAAVNPGARKYRSDFRAEETVLFLTRDWECPLDLAPPRSSDLAPRVVTVGGDFVVPVFAVRVVRSR